jgi:predicted esterase
LAPPYLCWWDASDDGRVYNGWEASREHLRSVVEANGVPGILGFSQGAAVAAAVAALSARGEFPPIAFAILVAGRKPRSDVLGPLFETPVAVPSLHVWGEKDPLSVPGSDGLFEAFEPTTREKHVWAGSHAVPTRGEAATRVVEFAKRYGA